MYQTTFRYGRKRMVMNAVSGIEVALWDIIGKARNLPVYEMIGGLCRDKIQAYASLPYYHTAREAVDVALHCVQRTWNSSCLYQAPHPKVEWGRTLNLNA